jgi:hypothetical protein
MTQQRRQREESFNDTCRLDLTLDTETSVGSKSYTQSWPAGSSVACNFTTPSSSPAKSGGIIEIAAEERGMIVALPYGTVINAPDRIRRASDGKFFEVIGTDKPGTFGVQLTVAVIELGI